jgi:hypothetical protein
MNGTNEIALANLAFSGEGIQALGRPSKFSIVAP